MKFTLRKPGTVEATVRITWYLDREQTIAILCAQAENLNWDEDPDRLLTRKQITEEVRHQLALNADAPRWWRDGFDDPDEVEQIEQWATRQVDHAFAKDFAAARKLAERIGVEYKGGPA